MAYGPFARGAALVRVPLLVVVVLLLSAEAESAPAPVRRPGSTCEVVFDARTNRRALVAERYLRSEQIDDLLNFDVLREYLAPLKSHDERRAWVQRRLSVSCERERLRVRLDGPLAILRLLADALSRDRGQAAIDQRDECKARLRELTLLRERKLCSDAEYFAGHERLLRCELLVDPLEVVQAPRPLGPDR